LLINHFYGDDRVAKVVNFGQLPNKLIFREIEEMQGISLGNYIANHIVITSHRARALSSSESTKNKSEFNSIKEDSQEKSDNDVTELSHDKSATQDMLSLAEKNSAMVMNKSTLFSEF